MTEILGLCDYREVFVQKKKEVNRLRLSNSLLNISEVAADVERWQFALTLVHDAMSIRVEHLGSQSTEVAECLGVLSKLHARQKQFDLAIRYGNEQLELLTRMLGDSHPETEVVTEWLNGLWHQGEGFAEKQHNALAEVSEPYG